MTTDLRAIPARPNLQQYKKQAKDLLARGGADSLTGAQLIIAREHGFASWPKFAAHVADLQRDGSPIADFESAADAIARGDAALLERRLHDRPSLARECSSRAHRATLLHYTAANGVEDFRQRTPANIVAIAELLLDAGADVDAVANIYGGSAALSLAASSVHPERAGVQIPLLAVLLDRGAAIDGVAGTANPLLAALRNGRGAAAAYLADRGARLDLEGAAGTGRLDVVRAIVERGDADDDERSAGLAWASQYGHAGVVEYLLDAGTDPDRPAFGMPPLHWAVVGAQTDIVRLLLRRNASPHVVNRYGGTAPGQAHWSAEHDRDPARFAPIIALLRAESGA